MSHEINLLNKNVWKRVVYIYFVCVLDNNMLHGNTLGWVDGVEDYRGITSKRNCQEAGFEFDRIRCRGDRTEFQEILEPFFDCATMTFMAADAECCVVETTGAPATESPTQDPTRATSSPTQATDSPTQDPTQATSSPTQATDSPTRDPTESPTKVPSESPTQATSSPTQETQSPTVVPTRDPTPTTPAPTQATESPTQDPTQSPTTAAPTQATASPTESTESPTAAPANEITCRCKPSNPKKLQCNDTNNGKFKNRNECPAEAVLCPSCSLSPTPVQNTKQNKTILNKESRSSTAQVVFDQCCFGLSFLVSYVSPNRYYRGRSMHARRHPPKRFLSSQIFTKFTSHSKHKR